MRYSLIIFFCFFIIILNAQNDRAIDSLRNLINRAEKDTITAKAYNDLGTLYSLSVPESSEAAFKKALTISEQIGSKKYIATSQKNIGNLYLFKGDYSNAIERYMISLKLSEELGDKSGVTRCYNNIGIVYMYQKNYAKAIEYLDKSLKMAEELGDKALMASKYINFGYVYSELKEYNKSQDYYLKALKIFEENGDISGISTIHINMGVNYKNTKNYDKSLENYFKALKIVNELNDKKGLSIINNNLAEVYIEIGKNQEAVVHGLRGLEIAKELNALELQKDAYKMLFAANDSLGNYKDAYKYHKLYMQINDSIYNENSSRKINELLTKYGTEKKEKENEILIKDIAIKKLALEKELTLRNYLVTLFFLVIILVIFAFYRLYLKRKANRILKMKNELIRKQKKELSGTLVKLHNLNATKDKFFSIIGHDLRTPVQAIIGYSELLKIDKSELYTDKMRSKVDRIYNAGKNTSSLLSNLLDWSRSQTGALEFKPEKFSLINVFEVELDTLNISARKKHITISTAITEDIEVLADKNMICTVIRNLVSNAIKFTYEDGYIKISSRKTEELIETTVSDSGTGINPEIIDQIFNIDFKSSVKGTNDEPGTGLGLVLCKEFVERNNGRITVESTFGKGSSFTFTLPSA